jgi:hypothetical protein
MSQVADNPAEAVALTLAQEFGPGRVLLSDIRAAWLLADAARHNVIGRVFGVSKDQENLLTLVAVLALADAVTTSVRKLHALPGPSLWGDGLLGATGFREALCGVAGQSSRTSPSTGTLLMLAVLAGGSAPAIVKSLHGLRTGTHRMTVGFRHRYGYLVDPGHRRQRRFDRREAAGS